MNNFIDLASPGAKALKPYQPGKPIEELQRELGVKEVVKLASNENPLGPSPLVLEAIQRQLLETARYPDGNGFALKEALAQHLGVSAKQITLGNGSNDVLELIARTFASADDEIIFSQYAFAIYPIVTQAINAKAVKVPAKQWGHDMDAMLAAVTEATKVVFIANPNNPTGTWVNKSNLIQFLENVPRKVIVVVDEAYFEYASDPCMQLQHYPNALNWLQRFPNLIVTRTFSKAYGLAGLRVGYAVSHEGIADLLNRVRQPFNVNHLALAAAVAALKDKDYLQQTIKVNCEGLKYLQHGFDTMGLDYIPSCGNFICVEVGDEAADIYNALLRNGVIVRPVANYSMPKHLRISVGLPGENERFLKVLANVMTFCHA
ncbi:MAG: aspartate aminotransferase [Gammaproteobacteria bacterium SG8_11]|nr:MAG: aspartate aminotransferase [Gammaproteobacteria bacterium SG8_11]